MDRTSTKVAVLIDADNISSEWLAQILTLIRENKLGEVKFCRAFGLQSTFCENSAWTKAAALYGIEARILQSAIDGKKNTADIALILDAMELALLEQIDALCLVSGDSDFRQLALRLRSRLSVYGFGTETTPISYRCALTRFFVLEKEESEAKGTTPSQKAFAHLPVPQCAKILLKAFEEACGAKNYCVKSAFGSRLSALRSQLPEHLRSVKKGLLNRVLTEPGCSEIFIEEGDKQATIVRRR